MCASMSARKRNKVAEIRLKPPSFVGFVEWHNWVKELVEHLSLIYQVNSYYDGDEQAFIIELFEAE